MVNPARVKGRRAALYAVDNVPFLEKQFGEIGAILACDSCNESDFIRHLNQQNDWRGLIAGGGRLRKAEKSANLIAFSKEFPDSLRGFDFLTFGGASPG